MLEFSKPQNRFISKAYDAFSELWPIAGKMIVGTVKAIAIWWNQFVSIRIRKPCSPCWTTPALWTPASTMSSTASALSTLASSPEVPEWSIRLSAASP